mgnify:CR=1 FL=1
MVVCFNQSYALFFHVWATPLVNCIRNACDDMAMALICWLGNSDNTGLLQKKTCALSVVDYVCVWFGIPRVVAGWASGLITLSAFTAYGPYFDKKKAISVGISGSGSGLGTIIIPIILCTLFDNYSFTGAMLIFCK